MIRYRRGDEPEALAKQRRWRLARLKLAWLQWCDGDDNDSTDARAVRAFVGGVESWAGVGYSVDEVRRLLQSDAELKCVWCEGEVQPSDPIDHFRPRKGWPPKQDAAGRDATTEHTGYWWLTWSWQNLLPACSTCNGPKHKGSKFPLDREGVRCLPFHDPDDETERPLLLDPSREDPYQMIRYAAVAEGGNLVPPRRLRDRLPPGTPRFVAEAFTDDPRAEKTIEVLGLASGALDANWEKHLGFVWQSELGPLRGAIDALLIGQAPTIDVHATWEKVVRLHVSSPLANRRALTRAFIDHVIPFEQRAAVGLSELPSLEDPGPPEPCAPLFEATDLRRQNERLALAIEACASTHNDDLKCAWQVFEAQGETIEALADALGMAVARLRERLGLAG